MPIPIITPITPVTPNTLRYDLNLTSRVQDGALKVFAVLTVHPCRCDENGVYTDCPFAPSQQLVIDDLERYAAEHPELAPQIGQTWAAISAAVAAINAHEGLL